MTSSRGILIGLGAAALALVLVMRGASPDPAPQTSSFPEAQDGTAADRRSADESQVGGGAPRPGVGSGLNRRGEGAQVGGAEGSRPRQLAGQGGVPRRAGTRGGGTANGRSLSSGGVALPDGAPRPRAPELTDREAPPAGAPGTRDEAQAFEDDETAEAPSDVAYDSGDDKVFDTGSKVEITDAAPIEGAAGTISFWLEPEWEANSQEGASFVQLGDGSLAIVKEGNQLRFQYTDATGVQHSGSADIADWKAGDWRNVIATWRGNMSALYLDGGQAFLNYSPNPPAFANGTTLYVGSTPLPNGAPMAVGQLSYLTVMNRDASVDEVKQMFESGGRPQQ